MSDKLVNIITCDNMKADVVLLADGKITAMEFSQMHKKIEKLEASNKELLDALEDLIYECGQAKECGLIDWKVMGTAREVAHKMRGIQQ